MTETSGSAGDKAGIEYWNENWKIGDLPAAWNLDRGQIGSYVDCEFYALLEKVISDLKLRDTSAEVIEVGCARSVVLPVLAKSFGLRVAGLDYSSIGCQQAEAILRREGAAGVIHCGDVFSPPDEIKERFDLVVSFGLVEHFSETKGIVSALAGLLRPGGAILTTIPNMNGAVGAAQRVIDRGVFDVHVPLTAEQLAAAHSGAGLEVRGCSYFVPTNFGLVNLTSPGRRGPVWWAKKCLLAVLARLSVIGWWIDRNVVKLPVSSAFSPYIWCVARKPE